LTPSWPLNFHWQRFQGLGSSTADLNILKIRYRLVSLFMRNPDMTKEKILKKSGILFNTKGYKATSISDITDATGFTKGAIYRHFKSKEELEKETLYHLSSIMFGETRQRIKEQLTAGDKLRAVFRYFESYITDPVVKGGCPLLNAAIESDDAHPGLRKAALRILDILRDSVMAILENGIRYKQLKPLIDKEYYATLIIASLEGAIMMSKLRGDNEDIRRVIKHLDLQVDEIEL
jgi:TetR/AcrR family transcriptional repressor of nem operon